MNDLIPEIRSISGDALAGNYKFDDSYIAGKVSDALSMLFSIRPDAFMVSVVVTAAPAVSDAADEVPVLPQFKQAVIFVTASLLLAHNPTDKASVAASDGLMKKFYSAAGVA
ncbi:MAG: hypothetical protein JXR25_11845 [Pontiellaceae bacterium]|nr:hypothetical protein [Pontiellaceae bacterium]